MSHLRFMEDSSYEGKTRRTFVQSCHDDSLLGIIKWDCGWRQYVFHPEPDCRWSWDCLEELSLFIKGEMEKRVERGKE